MKSATKFKPGLGMRYPAEHNQRLYNKV